MAVDAGAVLLGAWPGQRAIEWIASHPLETLQSVLGLGFVIFVHELGHFLVAKACGVKCEKFYLGFDVGGLKLCSFKWGETEYGIGALPLGGYVKMLGQDDNPGAAAAEAHRARATGDLPAEPTSDPHPTWDPRSYPAQSVPERMAIISAGVIMNVIFAILMASLAFGLGVREVASGTSAVRPGGAAWRAGLRTGDGIVAIGGTPVTMFKELQKKVTLGDLSQGVAFTVRRPGEDRDLDVTLRPDTDGGAPMVGLSGPLSLTLPADLGEGLPGSAGKASPAFVGGDTIRAVDGTPVETHAQLVTLLSRNRESAVTLSVDRKGERLDVVLPPRPQMSLGLVMTPEAIQAVQDGSPAAEAGLRAGDRLVTVDGAPVGDPFTLDQRLRPRVGTAVSMVVERAGVEETVAVTPREVTWIDASPMRATPLAVSSIGIALPVSATVVAVDADGPAAGAGIGAGDRLTRVRFVEAGAPEEGAGSWLALSEGEPNWPGVIALLPQLPAGSKVEVTVENAAGSRDVALEPAVVEGDFLADRGLVFEQVYRTERAATIGTALSRGFATALEDLSMVYRFLQKLWSRQISARLLGGPMSILQQAGRSAEEGFSALLLFLTMLSANLAVVNFLPIPVLDGGHMVFLIYEWVTGRPPSERVVIALSYLGLILILSLMLWVFGLDLGLVSRFAPAK
jgi:regulator of sigma E protease